MRIALVVGKNNIAADVQMCTVRWTRMGNLTTFLFVNVRIANDTCINRLVFVFIFFTGFAVFFTRSVSFLKRQSRNFVKETQIQM